MAFTGLSRALCFVTALGLTVGCKTTDDASGVKSISDGTYVMGVVQRTDAQGNRVGAFNFLVCRLTDSQRVTAEDFNDPQRCINPYVDASGSALTLNFQEFKTTQDLQQYLKIKGYAKMGVVAIGGAVVCFAGGEVLGLFAGDGAGLAVDLGTAGPVSAGVVNAAGYFGVNSATLGGAVGGTTGAATGAGGVQVMSKYVWGNSDRLAASALSSIMGKGFYDASPVPNVKSLVTIIGSDAGLKVNQDLTAF